MNPLSTQEVLQILPHRYPFLMIDRVIDYDSHHLVAIKNFTVNEPYVQGHFPENHIMPGVMMVESMAQASTILAWKYVVNHVSSEDMSKYFKGPGVLFVGADQVRFKKVVLPGDQLTVYSTLIRNARNLFDFETRIEVNGLVVIEAKLKAMGGV
jgi:3-hydroxyacyl-[acyl-carrier-protein] dehydratase